MANHPGILNSEIKNNTVKRERYKAPEIKPITNQVNDPTDTVQGRLSSLLSKGSTYTNYASNEAQREANSRGMLNSSMAAAAGTEAAIKSALPIAQQDSKTYSDTRMANQNVENKFLENRQSTNLNMEAADQGSELINEQNTLSNNLGMRRDSASNDLAMQRDTALSSLTQEENAQLNDLTMKRDKGLSVLTQEENSQLAQLQEKRDKLIAGQQATQSKLDNQLNINRDNNSAQLNEKLATLESSLKQGEMKLDADLRQTVEAALQSGKFSDEAKMNILASMNTIVGNAQNQILQVGLSDRSAAQQAAAIIDIKNNRDASLKVYENLLKSFPGWKWGTDFTPGTPGAGSTAGSPPPQTQADKDREIAGNVYKGLYKDQNKPPSGTMKAGNVGGARYWRSSDGKWQWNNMKGQWFPIGTRFASNGDPIN